MEMVEFNCPHCGYPLLAPAHMDGETHACPKCECPVTLQVITKKQAAAATLVGATLGLLAAWFDS